MNWQAGRGDVLLCAGEEVNRKFFLSDGCELRRILFFAQEYIRASCWAESKHSSLVATPFDSAQGDERLVWKHRSTHHDLDKYFSDADILKNNLNEFLIRK